jgi:all-trans-retinol 13,14-reductase
LLVNGASGTLPELLDDADVAEVGTPITFHRFLGSDLGAWYGLEHNIERFRPRNFYLTLRPECDIDGLYLTGEDVSTDGVMGAMIGGYLCVSKIMGVRNFMDLPQMISEIKSTKA